MYTEKSIAHWDGEQMLEWLQNKKEAGDDLTKIRFATDDVRGTGPGAPEFEHFPTIVNYNTNGS